MNPNADNSPAAPDTAAHWQLASTWWVLGCGVCWLKLSLLLSRLLAGYPLKVPLLVGAFGVAHGLVWAKAVAPGWRLARLVGPGRRAVVGWLVLLVLGQLAWLAVALWLACPGRWAG